MKTPTSGVERSDAGENPSNGSLQGHYTQRISARQTEKREAAWE